MGDRPKVSRQGRGLLSKPRIEDFKTGGEYRHAKRVWRNRYGAWRSAFGSVAVFFLLVFLTRSALFSIAALVVMLVVPVLRGARVDATEREAVARKAQQQPK